MNLGPPELLIILGVLLLLFGSAQVPKLARSLGRAKREFEDGLRETHDVRREEKRGTDADDGSDG